MLGKKETTGRKEDGVLEHLCCTMPGIQIRVSQINRGKLSLEIGCPAVKVLGSAGEDGSPPAACLSSLPAKPGHG